MTDAAGADRQRAVCRHQCTNCSKEYRALMQRLQDLEDTLELDEAVDTATGFRAYAEIRTELQSEGKL